MARQPEWFDEGGSVNTEPADEPAVATAER